MSDFYVLKEIVLRFGDKNPEHGGGVVSRCDDGSLHVEYTDGPEEDGEEKEAYTIYRCDLPDDVFAEHDWVDEDGVESIAHSIGWDPAKDEDSPFMNRGRTLRELGASKKMEDRLYVLESIASHWGWGELDHYPLIVGEEEMKVRWGLEQLKPIRIDIDERECEGFTTRGVDGTWYMRKDYTKSSSPDTGIREFSTRIELNGIKMVLYSIPVKETSSGTVGTTEYAVRALEGFRAMYDAMYGPARHIESVKIGEESVVFVLVPR